LSEFKKIKISDFSYSLPDERIAKYPPAIRDSSGLLIWQKGEITKDTFKNVASYLTKDALLVFNNTRVIHARLLFKKDTGARIEVFCLEPAQTADYQQAFMQKEKAVWKCMLGNAKKWKEGTLSKVILLAGQSVSLKAKMVGRAESGYLIEFKWNGGFTFAEIIEHSGILPLPPYLNRETEPGDEESYQTVYAKSDGSVAAPTAGLHFTEKILAELEEKRIALQEITLHVGAGTFQPVKSETISGHTMHHEKVLIPRSFIEEMIINPRRIIAVGTTSVRSLESLYWLGLKLESNPDLHENPEVGQWEPYEREATITVKQALENTHRFLIKNRKEMLQFSTRLIIVPGYRFQLIEGMFTNFHQPGSTLLLLISAFLGNDWKKVYEYALRNEFRFLSYGDSNLYLK
jgi:S-adenosylmethionine:tRNA ribosyltransferase-isomerase